MECESRSRLNFGGYGLGGYWDELEYVLEIELEACSATLLIVEAATSAPEANLSAYFRASTRMARIAERDATSFWARKIT